MIQTGIQAICTIETTVPVQLKSWRKRWIQIKMMLKLTEKINVKFSSLNQYERLSVDNVTILKEIIVFLSFDNVDASSNLVSSFSSDFKILEDADALDHIRFGNNLNISYLKEDVAIRLIGYAIKLYRKRWIG
ncbi:MAG: hypothetical protein LKJ60_03905 [Lentilactobacillus buchneri]|jgi:hypothetical protein|nr:hypothetical protein [Lentilactobacillus buchneri]